MHQLKLKGSYEAMGTQYGNVLRMVKIQVPPANPHYLELAKACRVELEKHAPELSAELEAMITTSGLGYDDLLTLSITAPLQRDAPSCSVVAVLPERTTSGKILVGRNYDLYYDIAKASATTYFTYTKGAYAHVSNCDTWVGREDGLNEKGLFVGCAVTFLPEIKPGLVFWFIIRMILDRCATVDEAIALLEEVPHASSFNYLLADKSGKAAVVEGTPSGIIIREPKDGVIAIANHVETPALIERQMFVPPDSHLRAGALCSIVDAPVDLDSMKKALNNHNTGVNAHAEMFGKMFGTIWSVAGYLDGRKIDIAEGRNGGQMKYKTVTF